MAEATDFLYPFIEGDERDVSTLLAELSRSAAAKWGDSVALREQALADNEAVLDAAADAMVERFSAGGRLLTFGNGGSATDAGATARLFATGGDGRATPLPARSLAEDPAVLTALANDIGVDGVFSRQVIAAAGEDDIALGLSTSGSSENLLVAFREARRRGLLTVGVSGYAGGRMGQSPDVTHCLVVRSDSVHRIQEVQTALVATLWHRVHTRLDERTMR